MASNKTLAISIPLINLNLKSVKAVISRPYKCNLCERGFETIAGRNIHHTHCKRKHGSDNNISSHILNIINTPTQADTIRTNNAPMANLPAFEKVDHAPKCRWNHLSGTEFSKLIDAIYNETVKWRKNLFKLPSGNAAKQFISELSLWLEHFNRGTEFQGIALKVYMILPNLLLQKPSRTSKAKDHLQKLADRLNLWKKGKYLTF